LKINLLTATTFSFIRASGYKYLDDSVCQQQQQQQEQVSTGEREDKFV
jgi:hypothetical protein